MTSATPTSLALKIQESRRSTGLSQKKFAQRIGSHLSNEFRKPTRFDVMRWERGDEPRLKMLEAIAKASGKPVTFFFGDDEDEEAAQLRRGLTILEDLHAALVVVKQRSGAGQWRNL